MSEVGSVREYIMKSKPDLLFAMTFLKLDQPVFTAYILSYHMILIHVYLY